MAKKCREKNQDAGDQQATPTPTEEEWWNLVHECISKHHLDLAPQGQCHTATETWLIKFVLYNIELGKGKHWSEWLAPPQAAGARRLRWTTLNELYSLPTFAVDAHIECDSRDNRQFMLQDVERRGGYHPKGEFYMAGSEPNSLDDAQEVDPCFSF